jgi:predicted metalloprotease with PDZ domain
MAITEADFLRNLNFTAARYYTDALNGTPNSEIWKHFWEDTRIRTLPYDRGSLYFATVDAQVRKASAGSRSLDNLILAMLDRRRRGEVMSRQTWVDLLVREAGSRAKTEFEQMLAGAVVLPESDAFGPCFRRTMQPLRRYELGFDPKVLIEPSRTIRGLIPGSAAQKAGLRDGDRILKPVPQDGIQGNQTEQQTLSIKREDKTFTITYLPRGETVQAYQWERVPGVPDGACLLPSTVPSESGQRLQKTVDVGHVVVNGWRETDPIAAEADIDLHGFEPLG